MRKVKLLVAMLSMTMLVAAPAMANTATGQLGGLSVEASSSFLGGDFAEAEAGGLTVTAENSFLDDDFFDDDVLDDDFFD